MMPLVKRRPFTLLAALMPLSALLATLFYVAVLRPSKMPLPISDNSALVLSRDGRSLLYWNTNENAVRLRKMASASEQSFPTQGWVSFCFAPNSQSFALLSLKGRGSTGAPLAQVEWRDVASGKLRRAFSALPYNDNAYLRGQMVRFSADNKALLVLVDRGIKVLPLNGSRSRVLPWPAQKNRELVAWNEKYWLMEYSLQEKAHALEVYNAQTRRLVRSINLKRDYIQRAQLSPDSKLIAVRDAEGVLGTTTSDEGNYVIEVATGKKLQDFAALDFLFVPDSKRLVAQKNDNGTRKVVLYEARTGKLLRILQAPTDRLNLAAGTFTPDGKGFYATNGSRNKGALWKVQVG